MKVTKWPVALLCGMALALPLAAQEEPVPAEPPPPPPPTETKPAPTEAAKPPKSTEPALHRWGGWTLSLAGWEPALINADEEIAIKIEGGVNSSLMAGSSSRVRETAEVTYHLPRDAGAIVGRFDSMLHSDITQDFTPGQFNFFESRGFPFALGAFDDGLADGVASDITRKSREFRLEFAKRAFESKVARGTFKAGYRQLDHERDVQIASFAIVPNLPPVIPPAVPDTDDPLRLQPLPDFVHQKSKFFGHGIGAALDVDFPLHERFSIITGLSIGLIRGASENSYQSTSSYYFVSGAEDVPLTKDQLFAILQSGTSDQIEAVSQAIVTFAVDQPKTDKIAVTYDVYAGFQGTVWRGLKLFATLRQVYYSNVGEYAVLKPDGSIEKTPLNVGYEGYCLGLSWRF
jgi:hypothetical protein